MDRGGPLWLEFRYWRRRKRIPAVQSCLSDPPSQSDDDDANRRNSRSSSGHTFVPSFPDSAFRLAYYTFRHRSTDMARHRGDDSPLVALCLPEALSTPAAAPRRAPMSRCTSPLSSWASVSRSSSVVASSREHGYLMECVVRFAPNGVEVEISSDGAPSSRVFPTGTQAVAWAEEERGRGRSSKCKPNLPTPQENNY